MTLPDSIFVEFLSDTTFGGGTGLAGEVDLEVDHDELGLPRISGKTIRGLLKDTFLSMAASFPINTASATKVFGVEGALVSPTILHISDAQVGDSVREWIQFALQTNTALSSRDILHSLTSIRYQSSEDRATGAPEDHSLRSMRVVASGLTLTAPLTWSGTGDTEALRYLAMAILGTRHAGIARNRGHGFISMSLDGDPDWTRKLAGAQR